MKSNKANIEAKSGLGITFHYAHIERGEAERRLEGGDVKESRLQCGEPDEAIQYGAAGQGAILQDLLLLDATPLSNR